MLWGHRNDPENFHRCLQDFDRRLPDLLDALREGDLLILTSDHGCDPTTPSTDHSREYALLLAYVEGRNAAGRVHEGGEFADVGATVNAWLGGQAPRAAARQGRSSSRERRVIRPAELIQRKRDGEELGSDEIAELVLGYARGEIPDYQLAAFCMAVYFRGLSPRETFALTDAMIASGETLDLGARARAQGRRQALDRRRGRQDVARGRADRRRVRRAVREDERPRARPHRRHARQARVDPGLPRRARRWTSSSRRCATSGIAIIGQTADLVPADKLLYALRDVTATVDQVSLIAASIMSKKLAAGAQAIVLDVKVGDGAFMKTLDDARRLAETMLALGEQAGREVVCLLTDMDQPLGAAVGNALEVREALATVRGDGPGRLHRARARRVRAAARALRSRDRRGRGRAGAPRTAVADGSAEATWRRWIEAQGGTADEDALEHGAGRPRGRRRRARAPSTRLGAIRVGNAALHLGAGRRTKDDTIDHAVGVVCLRKRGDAVEAGEPLAEVHARDDALRPRARSPRSRPRTSSATSRSPQRPVLLEVVG